MAVREPPSGCRGRRVHVPPGDERGPRRRAPRSGEPRSTTTRIASTSPRSPTTSRRSSASTPTSARRTPTGSSSPSEPMETGDPRIVAFVAALRRGPLWFLSMLFVLPEMQGRRPRAGAARAGAAGEPGARLWRRARTAPSRSRTRCTPRSGWCRACRSCGSSACRTGRGDLPPLPDGISAVPFDEIRRRRRPTGSKASALDDELDALDREVVGFAHRQDHAHGPARGQRSDFCSSGRAATRRLRLRLGGRAGRAGRRPRRGAPRSDPRPSPGDRRRRAAHSESGCRVRPTTATTTLLRAGFRVDGFPCFCAGTGR